MTEATPIPHRAGQRVRSVFHEAEGVVIESNPRATLIEFEEEEGGECFTHRKWLPTRHWVSTTDASQASGLNPSISKAPSAWRGQ